MFDFSNPVLIIVLLGVAMGLSLLPKPSKRRRKPRHSTTTPVAPLDQLRQSSPEILSKGELRPKPLMSGPEYKVFAQLEMLAGQSPDRLRVFAQTSLGEVFRAKDRKAYNLLNAKRVDFLVTDAGGMPLAAIEYQGSGHYQKTAVARDSVKREAFRLIGVPFIEIAKDGISQGQLVDLRRLMNLPVTVAAL